MALSAAMSAALSGLRVTGRRTDLTSNNIANTETQGYTRKLGPSVPLVLGGEGRGVRLAEVRRSADPLLANVARQETAQAGFLDVQVEAMQRLTQEIGEPQDERSLASALNRLERAFIDLQSAPEAQTNQRAVLNAAQGLTQQFGSLSRNTQQLRAEADAAIAYEVETVNNALQELDEIELELTKFRLSNKDVTGLEDRRDQLIDTVAERLPVRVLNNGGQTQLFTAEGLTLYDGKPGTLTFTRAPQMAPDLVYDSQGINAPGTTPMLSGLQINGMDIAPGSGRSQAIESGTIAGHFALRDTVLPRAQDQLDQLAAGLIEQFQDPNNDLSVVPGDPVLASGLFTRDGIAYDAADPVQLVGLANRVAVNTIVDPAQGGDLTKLRDGIHAPAGGEAGATDQIARFLDIFTQPIAFTAETGLPNTISLRNGVQELVGLQQTERVRLENSAEQQNFLALEINTTLDNKTGVNLDTELQQMLVLERAYAANAQMLQTTTRMLDELLELR